MSREIVSEDDATPEVLALAEDIVNSHYPTGPIDWEDVWDQMELDTTLDLDMGSDIKTPAMLKIKAYVKNRRNHGNEV